MPQTPISALRWNALLSDFRMSALTHATFCQFRGITLHTFRRRLYRAPFPESTSRPIDSPPTSPSAPSLS